MANASSSEVIARRPQRWETRFCDSMSERDVDQLLSLPPFRQMQPERFPAACSLRGLLLNDSRLVTARPGDILVREADYGHSAFLILRGSVRVMLESLPQRLLGRAARKRKSLWGLVWQNFCTSILPEVRDCRQPLWEPEMRPRTDEQQQRLFLQDVPGILDEYHSLRLEAGEIFGELAAMTRSPRTATVIAEEATVLLEIRWQGLRDLMRYDDALRKSIDQLYRQNSLESHLRETDCLSQVPSAGIAAIAAATTFESYGRFDWNVPFRQTLQQDPTLRVLEEPLIVEEGQPADSLLLLRSGFARVSRQYGDGHQTLAYLGKGRSFGLDELIYQHHYRQPQTMLSSLRAVGYVDVLRIPREVVEQWILPHLQPSLIRTTLAWITREVDVIARCLAGGIAKSRGESQLSMLEFLLDQRLMNGTQAMLIDTDRCTRCDDCVRACAATHDHNPRFVRRGPQFGKYMIAHACMHCVDPVCMIGCPTGAIGRDRLSGAVMINDATCIGCGTCANSCPYQNILMVETRDANGALIWDAQTQRPLVKATKCDLCTDVWGGPACQRACPHDALVRIDLSRVKPIVAWLQDHD